MSQAREIPVVALPGGAHMPLVGFGTWKITGYRAEASAAAALAAGYRHIDTATVYGNEAEIGSALAESGVDREEVFITTKIRPTDVNKAPEVMRKSLRALRTDYVDLWLVHWPPSRPQEVRQLWNELRQLRDEGLTKAIGVSNYDLPMIDDLIEDSGEAPAVNQIRWSPSRYDADVVVGHKARGIVLEGYSPLRDKSLRDPVVAQIAAAHEVTPAQVILRWHIEHGTPVIPKSERPERIAANIDLFGFTLSQDEVSRIDDLSG